MATDEFQHQDSYAEGVDIVMLVHKEFGAFPGVVKMQVAQGDVYIDGEKWDGDKFFIPLEALKNKEIIVAGPDRSWKTRFLHD